MVAVSMIETSTLRRHALVIVTCILLMNIMLFLVCYLAVFAAKPDSTVYWISDSCTVERVSSKPDANKKQPPKAGVGPITPPI